MTNPPSKCGYCRNRITTHSARAWQRTPQGRPYCPCCGAIPADWQGQPEARANVTCGAGW